MVEVMKKSADPICPRSRAEFMSLFKGFELVEPGVVPTADWRPVPLEKSSLHVKRRNCASLVSPEGCRCGAICKPWHGYRTCL
ncbi:S-adenosyl methyltransferase [Kibdelosporangium aridum]|uniref:S-adenosyl methyltransferase n=1 Tax=Kibdelosporangium aridum TaxID=2030 RepID=A0A1W2G118_KIBAR|nr:S-adenosyl methyltransferase [Kibdelosporangium aridum]